MTDKTFDSNAIANYVVQAFQSAGDPVTNLKLQKLLYYIEGWYLAIKQEPLFREDFQAWIHGPVLPSVFHRFKEYRWNPIAIDVEPPNLPMELIEHINDVLDAYGSDSGWSLELRTHNETPWIHARGDLPADQPSNQIITKKSMNSFFSDFIENPNG